MVSMIKLLAMNTTLTGDLLEQSIFELLDAQIAAGQFFAKRENCKVFRKKGYHSKDRDGDIVFDVAVEMYMPGATEYSMLMLIECKHYSSPVPVSDIEEFFSKVQQVAAANCKAVLASNAAFQSGTQKFAKSKGIGLLRYFDASDFKWSLYRSPSASVRTGTAKESENVNEGLSVQSYASHVFDLYMQSPNLETNSLWDFVDDLVRNTDLPSKQLLAIANTNGRPSNQVPYLTNEELETKSLGILHENGYSEGEVSLDDICVRETRLTGLSVIRNAQANPEQFSNPVLGRITFVPLEICIYEQEVPNRGRERFTLAHELAHYLLGHSKYIASESCDDEDFSLTRSGAALGPDIARMEYQANYFASCILMPKASFVDDFWRMIRALYITDKGFGALYVDDQPCNLQNYEKVTRELMGRYGVSRTAAAIRLESLGLLRDVRTSMLPRST